MPSNLPGGFGDLAVFGRFVVKIQKKWLLGPVEAVSAKFSSNIKVVHGDSATDEPKKTDFEPLSPRYVQNTSLRAHWQ